MAMSGWLLAAGVLCGADAEELNRQLTSVVRKDPRSGRLVRSVRITPADSSLRPAAAVLDVGRAVEDAARVHSVDPLLVHAMIEVESGYNPFAVSPKGAEGLMQLIPSTARRFGVKNSYNLTENISGGVRYLRHLLDLFPDQRLAIAAYNAGEEAVRRYQGIPPYRETRNYVDLVSRKYAAARGSVAMAAAAIPGGEEVQRPIESFVDERGRFHIRNR